MTRATDGTVTTTRLRLGERYVPALDAVVDRRGAVTLAWQQAGGSYFVAASRRADDGTFETPAVLTDATDGRADDPRWEWPRRVT